MRILEHVIVPLITPFTDDTATLSEVRVARLVRFHIEHGAAGFVVGAEAGEVSSLSLSERKQMTEWVVREAHGLPVFVVASANTTASVIDLAQHAERHGARAALVKAPTSIPLNPAEKSAFASGVKRHANLPVLFLDSYEELTLTTVCGLSDVALGPLAVYSEVCPEEFVEGEMVSTPLAIFGADTARKVANEWVEYQSVIKGLFSENRSCRLGKAVMQVHGLDLGRPRGPVSEVDQHQLIILESVFKSLKLNAA